METLTAPAPAGEARALERFRALVQELRAPVTPVKLQLELLMADDLTPDQRRSVDLLQRNCTRLCELLEELDKAISALPALPAASRPAPA